MSGGQFLVGTGVTIGVAGIATFRSGRIDVGDSLNNTSIGECAEMQYTTGSQNVAYNTTVTTGGDNTAVGYALDANTTGGYNIAIGSYALFMIQMYDSNTATGEQIQQVIINCCWW